MLLRSTYNRRCLMQRGSLSIPQYTQNRLLRSTNRRKPIEEQQHHFGADSDDLDTTPHQPSASEKAEPWKALLEMPARAAWRVSSSVPPLNLQVALTAVLNEGGRSRKQLRRTHEAVLEQHRALSQRRERERQRLVLDIEYKPIDRQRDEGIHSVMYGPDEVLSSFYFRLFPHYVVVQRVLEEARSLLGHSFKPVRVLDFGVGIGSSSAAAISTFSSSVQWVHGVDPSKTMRDGAKFFLDELFQQTQKDATTANPESSTAIPRTTFSAHLSTDSAPGTFCLAMLSFTASELPHNAATLAVAAVCWEKIRPGGLFIMIEPGTPDGFSSVRSVRSMLLDCFSESDSANKETCHIIAPCTHNGRCPMERFQTKANSKYQKTQQDYMEAGESDSDSESESDIDDDIIQDEGHDDDDDGTRKGYCSFVQAMPGGTGSGKGEKFCYLVAQKRQLDENCDVEKVGSFANLPELMQRTLDSSTRMHEHETPQNSILSKEAIDLEARYLDSSDDDLGLELIRGDNNRQSYGRILRAPRKKKGHVLIDCCVAPGKVVRSKITKSLAYHLPGVYSASRKSRWGGLWPHVPFLIVK